GHLVAVVADRQLVAGAELALDDADPVDADAVGTVEVADDEVVVDLGDAAVPAGDLARVDLDVALGVPPDEEDRLVHEDAGPVVQRHEMSWHDWRPVGLRVPRGTHHCTIPRPRGRA